MGIDLGAYKFGFSTPETSVYKSQKGLTEEVVQNISRLKNEPAWMTQFRLKAYQTFLTKNMPTWGPDLSHINFDDIYYYLKPTQGQGRRWEDVPADIKQTFDRLGIPQAEREFLSGVSAQYESESVYGSLLKELADLGVIFLDTDSALKSYPEFFKEWFGKLIPPHDNKFAALNSAVWSGGSFLYIPKGVRVERPLQAYFRINARNMGQFERTLIIADEGSFVHYLEGCFTAGQKVKTSMGEKNIEDVRAGDRVYTHKGRLKEVERVQKRNYDGDLYEIEPYGDASLTIECTSEHPFLVSKRRLKKERNGKFLKEWVVARNLSRHDYLCLPIDREVITQKYITQYMTYRSDELEFAVPSSPEFFRLVGYYLSEGSVSLKGYVSFSFSVKETEYINDVINLVKTLFGDVGYSQTRYKDKAGIDTVFHSVKLARLFSTFGHHSYDKTIPSWMMKEGLEKQKELIIGAYRGDGNYYKAKCKAGIKELFRISTVSRTLAYQYRDILLRLGSFSFINAQSRTSSGRRVIYTVGVGGLFTHVFGNLVGKEVSNKMNGKNRATMFWVDEEYAYLPIKKISKKLVKNVPVYNFSVNEDESYQIRGVAVHNCTAPVYSSDSLHCGVVEVIVKKGARVRYTTIQNWSGDVYNLVTKRARVEEDGVMEWCDGNLGSKLTMKYPSCYLVGRRARGELLSIAYADKGQHQDTGGKMVHAAPDTSSRIISKSISLNGGRTSYRGLIKVAESAKNVKSKIQCDALLMDDKSATDTFPTMQIDESSAQIEHEATVSKVGQERLFYLMSRGLSEEEAAGLIVNGFIEPIVKELPLEYAVELNRLIELGMEGSVG